MHLKWFLGCVNHIFLTIPGVFCVFWSLKSHFLISWDLINFLSTYPLLGHFLRWNPQLGFCGYVSFSGYHDVVFRKVHNKINRTFFIYWSSMYDKQKKSYVTLKFGEFRKNCTFDTSKLTLPFFGLDSKTSFFEGDLIKT